MPFPYYRRLNRRDKAIYRQSDAIGQVELRAPRVLREPVEAVRKALTADDRVEVEARAQALVDAMMRQLGVEPLSVRVLAVRPRSADAELHGLYVREEGKKAVVHVWMRTAAHQRVVAYRTFVRTLLHEVCHHLDYALFDLADSFHTEGFFRRESSLVRQLVPPKTTRPRPRPRTHARSAPLARASRAKQLELPL